ncbi:Immunity protein CdiI [Thermoflexales bacterium]|nr:Immunity protein CdiI [Thermoflexales bacterium]
MFDITFTGATIDDEDESLHLGLITLGEATEGFAASLSFLTKEDYHRQWLEAARRLLERDSSSAFITCMYNPETANFINWWPVWRADEVVVFQEHLLFIGAEEGDENYSEWAARFSLANPYAAVRDWDSTHCEECRRTGICRRPRLGKPLSDEAIDVCPSEWCIHLADIEEFLKRRESAWK